MEYSAGYCAEYLDLTLDRNCGNHCIFRSNAVHDFSSEPIATQGDRSELESLRLLSLLVGGSARIRALPRVRRAIP